MFGQTLSSTKQSKFPIRYRDTKSSASLVVKLRTKRLEQDWVVKKSVQSLQAVQVAHTDNMKRGAKIVGRVIH